MNAKQSENSPNKSGLFNKEASAYRDGSYELTFTNKTGHSTLCEKGKPMSIQMSVTPSINIGFTCIKGFERLCTARWPR